MEGGIRGVYVKGRPYLVLLDELQAVGLPQVLGKILDLVLKQKEIIDKEKYISMDLRFL